MDPGSDPGRDEYGLPPVDIQIPDDARDLDPDVQAYYRELRTRRRRARARRFTGPLTRHGMVIPLITACLALTLLFGTLLTVLAGRHISAQRAGRTPGPAPGTSRSAGPSAASASPRPQLLPDAQVYLAGQPVNLRTLAPAVLAWVPAGCYTCGHVLGQLARQATRAHVRIYFVGSDRAVQDLELLAREAGPRYHLSVVDDPTDAIAIAYGPTQVTAIFAHSNGSVGNLDVVRNLPSPAGMQRFAARLRALASSTQPGPAGSSGPAQAPAPQAS